MAATTATQTAHVARAETRIPSLDGLRALSIGLVLVSHIAGTRGAFSQDILRPFGDLGGLGVRVFFVISGYLITTLLLEEEAKTGKISLSMFYLRRTLRIFPAAYAFILATTVAAIIGWVYLTRADIIYAITYTMNYDRQRAWGLGHLWSLSGEEQFYLLWPATIWGLGRVRAIRIAAVVCVLTPAVRLAFWYLLPTWRDMITVTFVTTVDAIAIGCVLAGARRWLEQNRLYTAFQSSRWFALAPLSVFLINTANARFARLEFAAGDSAQNLAIALCIHYAIRLPDRLIPRMLNLRVLTYVGVLSYSLYLWQQLFLNRHQPALLTSFPVNVICLAFAALVSYYVVERPFLALRRRLERRIASGVAR